MFPPFFGKWSAVMTLVIFAITAALLLHRSLLPEFTLLPLDIIQDIKPWDHLDLGPRANRLLIDPFFIFYPNRAFQTAAIQNGLLPLWNPYLFTGTPVMADPNFQPFYLPNLVSSIFLHVHIALPWLAWLHLTLTGMFMFLFLRKKGLQWIAATMGGGVWLLNGYLLVWLENPHRLSTAAWFPAIFWAYEIAVQDDKRTWAAIGGLFLGLAILGGQIQFIFFFGLIFALYALLNAYFRFKDGLSNGIVNFFLIAVIGISIGALLIVPAAEFSSFSQRTVFDAAGIFATRWPAQQLITLIAPDFFGNPSSSVHYWGAINYAEVTAYFGVISLLLAISAVFVARDKRFLLTTLILMAIILLIALGTPLVRALALAPGFQFLALRRSIIFIPFLGSWLAACGLDGWLRSDLTIRDKLVAITTSLMIILGTVLITLPFLSQSFLDNRAAALNTLWRALLLLTIAIPLIFAINRRPLLIGSLLLLLTLGELLQWGYKFNPILSVDYLYPQNAVTNYLKQDEDQFRVLPLQAGKAIFGPNILSVYSLETISGYSSLINGDYADLIRAMDDDIEIGWLRGNENILVMSHFHPLVGMLNVKYVLSAVELAEVPELVSRGQFDGVWIYEYLDAANRAFLVNDVRLESPENVLPTMLSAQFDWRSSALISTPLPDVQAKQLAESAAEPDGNVEITRYEPHAVAIQVEGAEPAFLILSDAFYPGWQAFLDGQQVPIYQTNHVLRGVFIPAGDHEIIFQFRPLNLFIGLGLAIFGILIAVLVLVLDKSRRNHGSIESRIS